MRVLAVTSRPPWVTGDGDSLILAQQLAVLADRHRVTLLCATRRGDVGPAPDGVEMEAFSMGVPAGLDYAIRRVHGLASGEPAHVHWVERRSLKRAFSQHLGLLPGPDLLYLFGWGTAQLWRWAPQIPAVHFAVDPWAQNTANRRLPGWRRLLDAGEGHRVEAHEARHYPKVARVVFVTGQDAEAVSARIPSAVVDAVANGVALGEEPVDPSVEPVVGFHGGFGVQTNVDAALFFANEVVPAMRARVPAATALIIGREPPPEVRALASEAITVTGAVDAVRPWLERCAVYVAPMTSGAGIKNKVLEAMAAGRPVVATELGLQGIGTSDGVFQCDDAIDIADRVAALLSDRAALVEAGRANRRRAAEEFSWEGSASRLEALWDEAVTTQRRVEDIADT